MLRCRFNAALHLSVAAACLSGVLALPAHAETLETSLVQAYQNNPTLNAQRAAVRVTDENVPQALSGYRPKITATASAGQLYQNLTNTQGGVMTSLKGDVTPLAYGITATQTLFNGFQTGNRTRQAESQVLAARET